MPEMLILNPARRRRASTGKKRRSSTKRRARRRNPINNLRARAVAPRRRSNPSRRRRSYGMSRRRRNPIFARRRRRSNPISVGGTARTVMNMVKDAAIGAAGAIGMDMLWARINGYLPSTLQRVPGQIGVGDAVFAVGTVVLGKALNRATRGLSVKMAQGALTVHAHRLASSMMPNGMALGYAVPAPVIPGSARVGPIVRRGGMSAYMAPGQTALLNRYQQPGVTALLNGSRTAQQREGVSPYR